MSKGGISVKVYIAGKISGDREYWDKFKWAEEDLEGEGFTVINPAELPEGLRPADYMRICFAMMDSADIVAFLPDYEQSRGAQIEWAWCQYVGKQTIYLESMSFYRAYPKEDDHQTAHIDREAWEPCSRCRPQENSLDRFSGHEFLIDDAEIYFYDSEDGWEGEEIKFCPWCGRPLTDEAWAELEKRVRRL